MKKILHQKYNKYELTSKEVGSLHDNLLKLVNRDTDNDYIVFTSPTELSVLDSEEVVIRIDAKKYTAKELLEVIEKAA